MRYRYDEKAVLSDRYAYSYSPYEGPDFIAAYIEARRTVISSLEERAGGVSLSGTPSLDPEGVEAGLKTFEIRRAASIISAREEERPSSLDLALLHHEAMLLYLKSSRIAYLNGALKIGDYLSMLERDELSPEAAALAARGLRLELDAVTDLHENLGSAGKKNPAE